MTFDMKYIYGIFYCIASGDYSWFGCDGATKSCTGHRMHVTYTLHVTTLNSTETKIAT